MRIYPIQPLLRAVLVAVLCSGAALAQAPLYPKTSLAPMPPAQALPAQRQFYIQMATAIGDDYFDGNDSIERVRRHLKIAQAAGVYYLRCAFSWNGIQPEPGVYNFAFWDQLVDEAARAGITLIPYVAYTPEWAARQEERFWQQPPRNPELYAAFMRKLAERYRGKIRSWELWNEPDNKEYWDGSPDDFASMVIPAAQAIREVAPEDVLVLGGMSNGPAKFFDVLVTQYHVDQYVDVLALHGYPESWQEERAENVFGPWVQEMYTVANRSHRALWLNEMGYADYRYQPNHASVWGTNTYYAYEHTRQYAADFLFKSYVMTLASGHVSLAGWYRIDDFRENDPRMPTDKVHDHLGITDVHGKLKPAFFALRFFNTLFSKPTRTIDQVGSVSALSPIKTPSRSQAVVHVFQRTDGKLVVAGWLRSSNFAEVPVHSGMANDRREEHINVPLPCTATTINTYNAQGTRLSTWHPYTHTLSNVELTGDRVYVAEVNCAKKTSR